MYIEKHERWLLQHFGRTAFITDKLPLPAHIHLSLDSPLYAAHIPANILHHFFNEVKCLLKDDISKVIVEPVPGGEATNGAHAWWWYLKRMVNQDGL